MENRAHPKGKNHPCVKVDKLTGAIIEQYASCTEAGRENGISPGIIIDVTRRKTLYRSGRFFYRYADEYDPNEDWTGKYGRPIIGANQMLCVVGFFQSIEAAAKATNTCVSSINKNINQHTKRQDGWTFRLQQTPNDWYNVKAKAQSVGIEVQEFFG